MGDGYHIECKECRKKLDRERYVKKRDHVLKTVKKYNKKNKDKRKIYAFLEGANPEKRWGYLRGDGCCLYCGETDPFDLENHHPWKKHDPKFTITLCTKHHIYFTRGVPFLLTEWY